MAAPVRTQKDKPAPVASAPKPRVAAGGPAAYVPGRLSPMVAAAIMAGAERTARVQPQVPGRKPAGVHTTPPARVSDTPPTPGVTAVATLAAVAGGDKLAKPAAAVTTLPRPAAPMPASPAPNAPAGATAPAAAPPKSGRAAAAAPAAESGSAAPEAEAKPAPATEAKADKGAADAKGTRKGEGKGEAKAADKDKPADEAEGGSAGGGPAVAMKMPPPPSAPSRKTMQRIGGVARRAGGTAGAMARLPPGAEQAGDARKAVDQPSEESKAKAKADLIAALGSTPAPSPEIVALCDRIYKIIEKKRPVDEDALMEAEPAAEAKNAGDQLNETVEGETKKAQAAYGAIDKPPEGAAPAAGAPLPGQPDPAATKPIDAAAATPDPVPAAKVSLDADAEASKKKIADAGMETPAAQLVQTGPVADARGAQGELDQAAKEDPAAVLAKQQETLAKAEGNMVALQQQAVAALTASRAGTSKGATGQQKNMVETEADKRTRASKEAQQIYDDTQKTVNGLLQPLAKDALDKWEAAKTLLVAKFKADLAPVQKRVDERHEGASGFVVGLWDAVTGLPGWAEKGYSDAEKAFGDGVIAKLKEISAEVNGVVAACELLIKTARDRIAKVFADLGGNLAEWAAQEQATFNGKLDKLQQQAISARDGFNKEVMDSAKQAVDEVRAEVAALRKKAGGLLGRIADAVNRFLDDPVKFIIEGLLDLLGIPPAAFWAVVAKIKKVVKDIADDPLKFANNLMKGLAEGFGLFFDHFGTHLLKGFLSWLLGGLKDVQVPKDVSPRSIITFFLQIMGITWPNIRKILVRQIGAKNVALIEKVYSLVSLLVEKGPEGIYEMIKEKLTPEAIVDQVVSMAVDYMVTAIAKQVAVRILMLFNPAGAIVQALEAIYRVLKWVFQNAARIFALVETVVNGIADILAGNTGGFAKAVETALGMLIAPVLSFIADYLSLGDLPSVVAEKVKSMREWILGIIEKAVVWIIEKGKALLAAVGLGPKDKDKKKDKDDPDGEVGEELGWTAGTESHHMWIKAEGAHYVPMMASEKPHPIETALNIYAGEARKLQKDDKEKAALVKAAIEQGRKALATLLNALATVGEVKATPDAPASHLKQANAAVVAAEKPLRDAIAEIQEHLGINDELHLKTARKHFKKSPFSTRQDLAEALDISPGYANKLVQGWVSKGAVFRIESCTTDPEGLCTFDPASARWRETSPDNRRKYGYVNPKKTSQVGLQILSIGLLGRRLRDGSFVAATAAERRDPDYHQKKAHYVSVTDPGGYPDFMFGAAILGHAPPGASGHWNTKGHKQEREKNYEWNQKLSSYHGPEHWLESSASGASADRYELPTKARKSHESWYT
jgi:hypothetical protein